MTVGGFRRMVSRAGERAKFPSAVIPHMLRHACGYMLANEGSDTQANQVYMGHQNCLTSAPVEQFVSDAQRKILAHRNPHGVKVRHKLCPC